MRISVFVVMKRTFVLPIAGGPPLVSKDLLFRVEAPASVR